VKVVARHNSADTLSPAAVAHLDSSEVASFGLEIGREYTVFGMTLDRHGLFVLILAGKHGPRPSTVSIELFDVTDPRLGEDWLFRHQHEGGGTLHAMWGYPELVEDEMGFDGLFSEPRLSAHHALIDAIHREDIGESERADVEAFEAYVKRRTAPEEPQDESQD